MRIGIDLNVNLHTTQMNVLHQTEQAILLRYVGAVKILRMRTEDSNLGHYISFGMYQVTLSS